MQPLPVDAVSMRELSRATSKVFERLRQGGRPVVITHHGVPTALLSPIAAANGLVGILDRPEPDKKDEVHLILESLTDVERRAIELAEPGGPISAQRLIDELDLDGSTASITMGRLELKGLVKKRFFGYVRV